MQTLGAIAAFDVHCTAGVLAAVNGVEDAVDAEIQRLENQDEEELERLREERSHLGVRTPISLSAHPPMSVSAPPSCCPHSHLRVRTPISLSAHPSRCPHPHLAVHTPI